jgi:YihY family inner membrane protein
MLAKLKNTMSNFAHAGKTLSRIIGMAGYKFYWDDCFSRASSLAYTTLFALVPITALTFALFGAGGFNIRPEELQMFLERILSQVLPPNQNELLAKLHSEVINNLTNLGNAVRELGTVSLAVLIFTGIALLNTIESALNTVWRVTSNLSVVSKIISFWAVITLGPLLIAVSFYWYTKVSSHAEVPAFYSLEVTELLDFVIPIAAIWAALTLLFYKLPAARVMLRDAALGALIAAILFELMKRAFAYYVSLSTAYSTFYGALVTIPLFLFWLYLIWVVILFGAEISYQSGSIQVLHGLRKYASELGEVGAVLGLRILYAIGCRFVQGGAPPSESEIAIETGSDPVLVRTCLGILSDAGMITAVDPDKHSRSLSLSPDKISVGEVVKAFRAKRYRMAEFGSSESEGLNTFLEMLRAASLSADSNQSVHDWTLAQLIATKAQ